MTDTFIPKIRRGAGLPIIEQVPYFAEMAEFFLADTQSIVFIGSRPPVSFFAYPDKKVFYLLILLNYLSFVQMMMME